MQEQQQAGQPGPPQGMPGAMQWQDGQQPGQGVPPQGGPPQPPQGQPKAPPQAARPRPEDMQQGLESGKSLEPARDGMASFLKSYGVN